MIGQGAVGWKKRNARMNERLKAGVGVNNQVKLAREDQEGPFNASWETC